MRFNLQTLYALCGFADGRVSVAELDLDTYISTENMLPNKEGITRSAGLPTVTQTQAFQAEDVLISNIRPYFKKIWCADRNGGCSNDVLVLRAKDTCHSRFLYYLLSNDAFFDYATATAKETKMPRGDKGAMMRYQVPEITMAAQVEIAATLSCLDDKIALNNRINQNLEAQAQAIFDDIFPSVSQGEFSIGKHIKPRRGKTLISKDAISGDIPVIAGGLTPTVFHNEANTSSPVITISASGANAGFVNLWHIPVWSSDSSFIDSAMTDSVYFWYVLLKKRQGEIYDSQTGSAQPHIYPSHIENLATIALDENKIADCNEIITPLFETIGANIRESQTLAALRDTLLPRLMGGDVELLEGKQMDGLPVACNKIFIESKDHNNNATISDTFFKAKYYEYYLGYKAVADMAVDMHISKDNRLPFSSAVYPIMFLYRQFIELFLKETFMMLSPLGEIEKNKAIRKASHDLMKTWRLVKPLAEQWYLYYTNEWESIIENTEAYLIQWANKDKCSTSFRYPDTLSNERALSTT